MKPITVVEKRGAELEQLCAKLTEITDALARAWIGREELVYHPETNTITSQPRESRGEDLAALRARIAELDAIILRLRSGLPYWPLVSDSVSEDVKVSEGVKNRAEAVLTVRQAAERLGVSIRHVLTLLYEGKLPGSYKLGLQWQIPEEAIKARQARGRRP